MAQLVYTFGVDTTENNGSIDNARQVLGGKGAGLAEMSRLGLPVPPGFTLSTGVCSHYYDNGQAYPDELKPQLQAALSQVESKVQARFGDTAAPLLLSVRSGARVSMPGMMDTILNLGLNDETAEALAQQTDNARFAFDSYRRFIQMYADVVMGVESREFEDLLHRIKRDRQVRLDNELDAEALRELVDRYKKRVQDRTGQDFPQDVHAQLWGAVSAVMDSWMNPRAITYRQLHGFSDDWGTAVNVQAMVFGNRGEDSATGVAFTRDPSTGDRVFYGEFLINAQGEDVVAGIRTPQSITVQGKQPSNADKPSMEEAMPELYAELSGLAQQLETHFRDMQDIEFTVQEGKLWLLQTRTGKRTTAAALKVAVDMAEEGLIDRGEAVCRVEPAALDQLLHPRLDPNAQRDVLTRGLPASPGSASGVIALTADDAARRANRGEDVLLVRTETSPEDIEGMVAARGIITSRGGMTSHAAVVARGMGRPCVCGASEVEVDERAGTVTIAGRSFAAGDALTLDGATGEVMAGVLPTIEPQLGGDFETLMGWADEFRRLRVRANADTPQDAATARRLGAQGIGLCRTEHMFFEEDRIVAVRQMILSEDAAGRSAALARILPMQRSDFAALFRAMEGLPVNVRLLDPPLHEFLPHTDEEIASVAEAARVPVSTVKRRTEHLREANPMLGHRGCRLGITYPEIYEMQARALLEAAADVGDVQLEIMVPLIGTRRELELLAERVHAVARDVQQQVGKSVPFKLGTMIEVPRAALTAGDIAEVAEFFSFGTNDLTQTTFALSRDDAGTFIGAYKAAGIYPEDPFVTLDVDGVGQLVRMASRSGKQRRPDLHTGICGEHGGDPASIAFCHEAGLDYVSCSPFRVPIARLAAARAAIQGAGKK